MSCRERSLYVATVIYRYAWKVCIPTGGVIKTGGKISKHAFPARYGTVWCDNETAVRMTAVCSESDDLDTGEEVMHDYAMILW